MRNHQPKTLRDRIREVGAFANRLDALAEKPKREVVKKQEPMTEKQFVRFFGTKVRYVKYSQRGDYVGLMVRGDHGGFIIVRDGDTGTRKVRIIDVKDAKVHVTNRFIPLTNHDSASNVARGLLNYVY